MPSSIKLANNAVGRLATNISADTTLISLVPGDGAKFPSLLIGEYFPVTLIRGVDGAIEIVKVTSRSVDTFTVVRAQESTTALPFLAGDRIELRLTVGTLQNEFDSVYEDFSSSDSAKGSALIGYGTETVKAALDKRLPEIGNYAALRAYSGPVTAFHVRCVADIFDGGSGDFRVKVGDTTSADNGGTILIDAIGRRWFRDISGAANVQWFGARGDGTSNNASAFAAARAYLASLGRPCELVFPAGHYKYSESPNWAIQDATYTAQGAVFLECTGNGHAVILNGQATTNGNIYNCKFGSETPFIVASSPTGGHGVYFSSFHHGYLGVRVIGAGAGKSGVYGQFAVCSKFNVQVTKNGQPGNAWYNGAIPTYGMYLTELNPGELVSYCTFINTILEHTSSSGGYFDNVFGSTVIGGTMEGCGSVGLYLTANAFNNRFYGVDFEVNTDHDIYCLGRENQFINCDTEKKVTFDGYANNNVLDGGAHNDIYVGANCSDTKLIDFIYNRNNAGHTITDASGGKTYYRNVTDRVTNSTRNAPLAFDTITPTGSPFLFENVSQNEVDLIVRDGTVSDITFIRASGLGFISLGSSTGMIRLSRGDKVQVTYTEDPVIKLVTR